MTTILARYLQAAALHRWRSGSPHSWSRIWPHWHPGPAVATMPAGQVAEVPLEKITAQRPDLIIAQADPSLARSTS
jgi:ABC-type Fe3+-hydroxamate transport system substrate-binding protein